MSGRRNFASAAVVLVAFLAISGRVAVAQISVQEAEKKLRDKMANSASTTQPVGELARLTEENRQLRLRVADLEQQVATLRAAAGQGTAGQPATAPAVAASAPVSPIVGTWRGGDITRGSGYVLDFNPDGTYRRTFVSYNKKEIGNYRFVDANTIEMWTDPNTVGGQRNEYRVSINASQLILTPTVSEGVEVRNGRALVLAK